MDGEFWRDLDAHEREIDAAIAEDDVLHPVATREQAMRDALALVSACGRASRYAEQCTGGWMADPVGYRRLYRWVIYYLTGG